MNKNKFDIICDTVDNGIIILNRNLEIQFWNKWLEIRTNLNSKEVVNKKLTNIYPKINEQKLVRKITTALKLKSTTFFTSEINKNLIDIQLNKVTDKVFNNMQQNITITPLDYEEELVIVYVYDITLLSEVNYKLKVQKEAIEEKNSQLNLLLNTTMEAIILFKDKIIVDCNDMAIKFFNLDSKEDMINKDIEFINLPSELLKKDLKAPTEIELNYEENIYALVNLKQTILNNQTYQILTLLDITDIKRKEKLMQEQNKLAAMGEMIGNIAHQWRQPLSVISVSASSTKVKNKFEQLDDESLNLFMDKILDTTDHLSKTIEVFRDYLKEDKDKIIFDINENINKNLSIIEPLLNEHNIDVIKKFDKDIQIPNYYNEFSQVLMNILNNAKDALLLNIPGNEKRYILIETQKVSNEAVVTITDNAKGIDENIINRIYEPYFTTKHHYNGTGLGLYMTHKIINSSMKGKISVSNKTFQIDNNEFTGASFKIELNTH